MTGLLEAPAEPAEPAASAPHQQGADASDRRSGWSRLRVDLRLARRQVWRTRGSSALVMLLVALPVAGLAGAAVVVQSHVATPEQSATLELGRTQSWITVAGGPDPSRWQAADSAWDTSVATDENGRPINPVLPPPESPSGAIPSSADALELREYGTAFVDTATGSGRVGVTIGDTWDPRFVGRYTVTAGTAPTRASEAMVSPGLLDRLDARIGDDVTLSDSGRSFTITGTMRLLSTDPAVSELFLPEGTTDAGIADTVARWFVADWQPNLDELGELNRAGFVAYAHDLAVDPPAGAMTAGGGSESAMWAMVVVGSIVAVFCGYLVVLLAGAAFAVAARRQQRSLAVASSVGAARADVFRIVLLQGTVLGTIGGLVGAVAGVGLAAAMLAITDNGVLSSFWGNWGLQIPWWAIGGVLVFAIVVGTLAAIIPARTATRGDVLGALRGSRRPARLSPKRPLWGLGLMIAGLAGTVGGGLALAALNSGDAIDYSNPLRTVALYAIVLSPVLFQIGVIVAGHWVLATVSRPLSRVGLAPRLASRDAAANPSRVVPAFAAIAACVFLAAFVISTTAFTAKSSARYYGWGGPLDSVSVYMGDPAGQNDDALVRAAGELVEPGDPAATGVVWAPAQAPVDPQTGVSLDPEFPVYTLTSQTAAGDCTTCDPRAQRDAGQLTVVEPDELATVLGTDIPADVLADFRAGALVSVASANYGSFIADGHAQISQWTTAGLEDYHEALGGYYLGSTPAADLPEPDQLHTLPARAIESDRPQYSLMAVISPATARALGIDTVPQTLVAQFPEPPSDTLVDRLTAAAQNTRVGEAGTLDVRVERGPAPIDPWLWLIVGVAVVLVIGAGAICLGLARFERRPDDATLTAVGGTRSLRRRINAWQALILVGIGTIVGTVAGVIPMWGIAAGSSDYFAFSDTPWMFLGILALGLPIVMTIAAWLVPPRHPDLTRRTAIA